MNNALTIGRIGGIAIRIHASWLIIFFLVAWSLAVGYFPFVNPLASPAVHWLLGVISALLLFASVLAHELSHSLVARARGLGVHSITLFVFGGVSGLLGEPRRPASEFLIAAVGPLTSFVLAGLFYALRLAFSDAGAAVRAVLMYLTVINLLLGVFNLIPGFPLDGGRVLRSMIWQVTGSYARATRIAAGAGVLIGYLFIAFGVFELLSGNFLGGLWIAFIGWFLSGAAESTMQQQTLQEQLGGVRVADAMRAGPVTVSPNITVRELVDEYLLGRNLRALPVTEHGQLVGMVTLSDVRKAPVEDWYRTTVGAIMGGRDGLVTVGPDEPLAQALQAMAAGDYERLPVVEHGQLVGVLSRSDVVRRLHLRMTLGQAVGPRFERGRAEADEQRRAT